MNIDLVTMAAEHSATMDGIAALMKMMTGPPAGASWAALENSLSAMHKLIVIAAHEADELFVAASAEETEEAPETAATETDANEKIIQGNDTTTKPKRIPVVTPELKKEIVLRFKRGDTASMISADLGIGISTAYRVKAEAM